MATAQLVIPATFEHLDGTYAYGRHWSRERLQAGAYPAEMEPIAWAGTPAHLGGHWAVVRIPAVRVLGHTDLYRGEPVEHLWEFRDFAYNVRSGRRVLRVRGTQPIEYGAFWRIPTQGEA